ncbi:MAG: MmcB family DNA repair protein [Kiloniellales bacterium]
MAPVAMSNQHLSEDRSRAAPDLALPEGTGSVPLLGAEQIARGVCRSLGELGVATLTEFTLRSGRRVDVIGLDLNGEITIIEVKSSLADFRSDGKWHEYLDYCDRFYFAVAADFPREVLPEDCGLMVADAYGAAILREAPVTRLNGSRRKAQTLRFALAAALRLGALTDPQL